MLAVTGGLIADARKIKGGLSVIKISFDNTKQKSLAIFSSGINCLPKIRVRTFAGSERPKVDLMKMNLLSREGGNPRGGFAFTMILSFDYTRFIAASGILWRLLFLPKYQGELAGHRSFERPLSSRQTVLPWP